MYVYFLAQEGRCSPGDDLVFWKSMDVTTRHIRLISRAFTMTNKFGITCAHVWTSSSMAEFQLCILWSLVWTQVGKITVCTADET